MNDDPVIVLYKSKTCGKCTILSKIWDQIVAEMKLVKANLRIFILESPDDFGFFDFNRAPKDLLRYKNSFPTIILIPGPLWNIATAKLGNSNDIQIVEGVQIFNGYMLDSVPKMYDKPRYAYNKPAEFGRWLKDSLEQPDFKRVQNSATLFPKIITKMPEIKPILEKPKLKPEKVEYSLSSSLISNDVCSLKMLSKPRKNLF